MAKIDAPVTMTIIPDGTDFYFLTFLQHMIIYNTKYNPQDTPLKKEELTWGGWTSDTFGHKLHYPSPIESNISFDWESNPERKTTTNVSIKQTWEEWSKSDEAKQRLEYFKSVIAEEGSLNFGRIYHYPVWIDQHFSNININFYLHESKEISERNYYILGQTSGKVSAFLPDYSDNTREAVKKHKPECMIDYIKFFIENDREAVRNFLNYTLSTTTTEAQLDNSQYWVDLYTNQNDIILKNTWFYDRDF